MGKKTGYWLIAALLLVEVPRFFSALAHVDQGILGILTAVGTAVGLSFGSMYVFHTWWNTSKQRKDWLLVPFGANLALAVMILWPWAMGSLRGTGPAEVMAEPMEWAWTLAVVASPFVLMGGVTTALAFQKEHRKSTGSKTSEKEEIPKVPEVPVLVGPEADIIQAWREHPDPSFQSVADALGMAKSTLYGRVQQLERQGINVRGNNHR